MSAIKGTDLN